MFIELIIKEFRSIWRRSASCNDFGESPTKKRLPMELFITFFRKTSRTAAKINATGSITLADDKEVFSTGFDDKKSLFTPGKTVNETPSDLNTGA
ncbi:MAG: hypothetical protein FWF09_01790 [Bacteroidales bacterium]|nr:hypothetical protein [Bacteroidales bacterium]